MPAFKFDLGNSTTGPIGMVLRVRAETKEQALAIVQSNDCLPWCVELGSELQSIVYANVYLSMENVRIEDVQETEEGDGSGRDA